MPPSPPLRRTKQPRSSSSKQPLPSLLCGELGLVAPALPCVGGEPWGSLSARGAVTKPWGGDVVMWVGVGGDC